MKPINAVNQPDSEIIEELKEDPKAEVKSKKLITLGECSRFYFYILRDVVCKIVSIFILGGIENISLFGFYPILKSFDIMENIYNYIDFIIFGAIFYFFLRGKKKTNENKNSNTLVYEEDLLMDKSKSTYLYIFLVCFCFGLFLKLIICYIV